VTREAARMNLGSRKTAGTLVPGLDRIDDEDDDEDDDDSDVEREAATIFHCRTPIKSSA